MRFIVISVSPKSVSSVLRYGRGGYSMTLHIFICPKISAQIILYGVTVSHEQAVVVVCGIWRTKILAYTVCPSEVLAVKSVAPVDFALI